MATTPAGWYADPMQRHQYRYWDARQWTENVSDAGVTGTDPPSSPAPPVAAPSPAPTPAAAAVISPPPPAPVTPVAPVAPVALDGRTVTVIGSSRYYLGQMVMLVGFVAWVLIASVGWALSLASGGDPPIFLGTRSIGLGTEYYVPGVLLAVLPFLLLAFQPRTDRAARKRAARESLAAQMGTSWRFTTAYVAKSFRWRRITALVGAGLLLLVAVAVLGAASSDGYTSSGAAMALVVGSVLVLVGTVIQFFTESRQLPAP
jgi:hypothetical protein